MTKCYVILRPTPTGYVPVGVATVQPCSGFLICPAPMRRIVQDDDDYADEQRGDVAQHMSDLGSRWAISGGKAVRG